MPPHQSEDSILPDMVHENWTIPSKGEAGIFDQETFRDREGAVSFRNIGWFRASVMFLKCMFAVGVLSLPTTMYKLGAVGGALTIVGYGLFNTYCFVIIAEFRLKHSACHSIADIAHAVGGRITMEIAGFLMIAAYILVASAGIIGLSTGFNALSHHSICTVWWNLIATAVIALNHFLHVSFPFFAPHWCCVNSHCAWFSRAFLPCNVCSYLCGDEEIISKFSSPFRTFTTRY